MFIAISIRVSGLNFFSLFALASIVSVYAQSTYTTPYAFTTLAGGGGRSGNVDGLGAAARFASPFGAAVDSAGNVYIGDIVSHTIRRITATGAVTTLAGSPGNPGAADGTGTAAQFDTPSGLAVDALGNLYVADTGNHIVRRVTPAGVVTTLAGTAGVLGTADGTGAAARFWFPAAVAVDGAGNVFVCDSFNSTIRRITPAGVVTTFAGSAGNAGAVDGTGSSARLNQPTGLAIDSGGNLFVADISSHIVRRITPAGAVTTFAGTAGATGSTDGTGAAARFTQPSGIAVDGSGNVYVVGTANHNLRKITTAGVVTTLAGSGTAGSADGTGTAAQFNQPRGAAVDSTGNVYVADNNNQIVRKVSPAGAVTTLAGVTGTLVADGLGLAAGFRGPAGIAVGPDGSVYVSDTSQTLRKITPAGLVSTLAGLADTPGRVDATGAAARFNNPLGLAVNATGTVYVVSGPFVRAVTAGGTVSTLAGAVTQGTADGTGGAAQFSIPRGVALDRDGNLFVTDTNNHTLRRVTPAGVVSTFAGVAGQAGNVDGSAGAARFNLPRGIAADSSGNLYIADSGSHTLRKITPAGVVSTLAGSAGQPGSADGTGSDARFDQPRGVAVDSGGNVFVIDYNNQTLRRVTPAGVVSTIAGTPRVVGNVDATGAAARFNFPNDIAVDAAGAVYVADSSNSSIRKGMPAATAATEPTGSISNLSVRATLASAQTLIMGFTMQGGAKNVLLRAVGPGLTQFGVGGAMADPRVTLFQETTQLQANDNWGGGAALSTSFASVGAFGLPSASLDAALLRSLEGGHTAQVTGTGAGTVLVEAYDASTGFSPRLTNVSARNQSGTGGEILIAGFTISGTGTNLLIRGVGPTLAGFGVPGTLVDPKLEVYSGAVKIAENDTWAPALAPTFASVGAFALTAASRDAALVIALPPGSYTVQVLGADGGTGEALVELYELP